MQNAEFESIKKVVVQVEEDSGNERVVEPQRTLPVHARCQVIMLLINRNYAFDDVDNHYDDGNYDVDDNDENYTD